MIFTNSHLFQFIGLATLLIWTIELEGNIVGIIIAPICFIAGLTISIITGYRIYKIPKKWNNY
ncbi:hypothetical protein [Aestuariibaculum lutulentum]|uniref:Uncharacterized protein n=1 Tax=Aestuariibaculum lutulentum TaxID=2920935 RepID=A0ABS9RKT1_9FLAO|nr:hypothetical protein [Aestuariibaculum lutulentum]MCH4553553.1 hypothetical protein [Aestuariibaculum lutulentum]